MHHFSEHMPLPRTLKNRFQKRNVLKKHRWPSRFFLHVSAPRLTLMFSSSSSPSHLLSFAPPTTSSTTTGLGGSKLSASETTGDGTLKYDVHAETLRKNAVGRNRKSVSDRDVPLTPLHYHVCRCSRLILTSVTNLSGDAFVRKASRERRRGTSVCAMRTLLMFRRANSLCQT